MDPILNPYAPGAGTQPPELAGRDELLVKASTVLQRIKAGRFARSLILTGLRGAGKTVLLNRIRQEAEAADMITVRFEAAEGRSLPALLVPGLKTAILKLSRSKATAALIGRGLQALATFTNGMKLKYQDIEVALDIETEQDFLLATDLDEGLSNLFQTVGQLAKEKQTAIILFIDEIQVLAEEQLASLIMALHIAAQDLLPITMIAAGLPQITAKVGKAKTYAERLFEFSQIGQLSRSAATQALVVPAEKLGVQYSKGALDEILQQTEGYAYFIQEWGTHAWDNAKTSIITQKDAREATVHALAELDASFFRVRFDQLTAMQKNYLRAMAELNSAPHTSGEIAAALGRKVTDLGAIRAELISKGLIYSPSYGETAFTVPLFDAFMKRMIKK